MEKVHITKVSASDTDKNGQKLVNKFGKPYFKVGIQCNEYGSTFINGLMPFSPDRWEGTEQELDIYDEDYQGKTYKKFKLAPKVAPAGMSDETTRKIMSMLETILTEVRMIRGQGKPPMFPEIPEGHTTSSSMPQFHTEEMEEERIAASDIPF